MSLRQGREGGAAAVLRCLKERGSLTTLEAYGELGITRLGARIFELRQAGHSIESVMVTVPRRNGGTTRVARYTICAPGQALLWGDA